MRLRHCRNRHPGLPRLFHNEPLLLRCPELTDPSSSNNRLSRFHPAPRTHGIKPCLQRACRKKNALSRRPTVDAYNEEQLSINTGNAGTLLLKLHGDLRHPSRLIVSEADYDGFLAGYPLLATYLANQLIRKTAIWSKT
jgi:hypothetical protein